MATQAKQTKVSRPASEIVKTSLLDATKQINELKTILEELKQLSNTSLENSEERVRHLQTQSEKIKNSISAALEFRNQSTFSKYKQRILKTQRKKKSQKKQKTEEEEETSQRRHNLLSKIVDEVFEVQQKEFLKELQDQEKRKRDQEKAFELQKLKRKNARKAAVLIKLEQLRLLRKSQSKEEEGQISIPSLAELVHAAEEKHKKNIEQERRDQEEMDIQSGLIAPMDDIEKFYNQANTNMQKLLENRRMWDRYIVPENNGGSRIPQHFLEPPYPSSDAWKQFIVFE